MTPLVTVVIPTRNRRQLLLRTLHTVLAQESVDLEVTVVDEASSDGTGDELASLGEARVSVLRHDSPKGVAAARNAGVARARGQWVAFLDDDDLWAPSKLRRQLEAMEADGEARWACVGCVVVDSELGLLEAEEPPAERNIARPAFAYNMIPGGGSGVLASRAMLEESGGFDLALRNLADWDMWTRLAQRSPVASIASPLMAYLRHAGSLSHSIAGTEEELDHVLAKHAALRRQLDVDVNRAWWLRWIGEMHQRAGRRRPARRRIPRRRPPRRPAGMAAGRRSCGVARGDALARPAAEPQHAPWLASGGRCLAGAVEEPGASFCHWHPRH